MPSPRVGARSSPRDRVAPGPESTETLQAADALASPPCASGTGAETSGSGIGVTTSDSLMSGSATPESGMSRPAAPTMWATTRRIDRQVVAYMVGAAERDIPDSGVAEPDISESEVVTPIPEADGAEPEGPELSLIHISEP